jgi:hypothetical protein
VGLFLFLSFLSVVSLLISLLPLPLILTQLLPKVQLY